MPREMVRKIVGQNPGPFTGQGTNMYLLGGERLILVDTGAGVPADEGLLRSAIASSRGTLSLVLITHGHRDHIGGIEAVRRIAPEAVVRKFPGQELPGPYLAVRPDELIAIDGITLRAIHTPGHAADHLCFQWMEARVLFSGDLVLGEGPVVIPRRGGNLPDYLASLERVGALDVCRIYPGHGPLIENPARKIAADQRHRRMREQQILDCLHAHAATIEQIVDRVYAETPTELRAAAAESVWNHLAKLESEGRVRRVEAAGKDAYHRTP